MQQQYQTNIAPLLYRLVDEQPEEIAIDKQPLQYVNLAQLQQDILVHLQWLLNSKLDYFAYSDIKYFKKNKIYDMEYIEENGNFSIEEPQDLCRQIEQRITQFEPRLQQVKVALVDKQIENKPMIWVQIIAWLIYPSESNPSIFDSKLQLRSVL